MKRVLALHGHSQSAHVFNRKLAYIVEACRDELEFVFLDAPLIIRPADLSGVSASSASHPLREMRLAPSNHSPRAWWAQPLDGEEVDAQEVYASLVRLKQVLETRGLFHGVIGFCQGGALASLLTGLLEYPDYHPLFRDVDHPPFEFCVCISGFIIPSPTFIPPRGMTTPALIVAGLNDTIVLLDWTREIESFFVEARLEEHDGGHFVPRKSVWRKFFTDYFRAQAYAEPERYVCVNSGYNSDASESFLFLTSPEDNHSSLPPAYTFLPPSSDLIASMEDDEPSLPRQRAIFTFSEDTRSSSAIASETPSFPGSQTCSPTSSNPESPTLSQMNENSAGDIEECRKNHSDSNHGKSNETSEESHFLVELSVPSVVSFTAAATVLAFSASLLHRTKFVDRSV